MQLDRYLARDSLAHRADPRVKLVLTIGAILTIGLVPIGGFVALGLAWLGLVAVGLVARLGFWRLPRTAVVALPFLLVAAPLIFTRQGEPLGTIELGPFSATVSGDGLRWFCTIALKSWLSIQCALLLAFTTPFHDLVSALRALRLPRIMVAIIGFMYRYLAVLGEEATRMHRARMARSARLDRGAGGSVLWRARVTGAMVGSLFLRSYERSERIYAAMLARGFDGELRHLSMRRLERSEIWVVGAAAALLIGYLAIAQLVLPRW